MGKILVAMDFSECAMNAFIHALSIAQRCVCDINLVWVQKPETEKDKYVDKAEDSTRDVKRNFEDIIKKYQPELPKSKITYKIRTGKVYKEIVAEAESSEAMLVVAGTHGASGFEEFWIGSNANRIISASPCPVITIRAGIDIQHPLTKILMPIDSTVETRQKATFTAFLAKTHDAEIIVLKVYSSKSKSIRQNVDIYGAQVTRYLEQEGVKYMVDTVECENISDAYIDYAKKANVNLLSIMTEQETTASNLWMGPYAQQTVNHSPVPVLSIHSKDTYAAGSSF
jgi:nucleotide-binding universal stress UspA family protein